VRNRGIGADTTDGLLRRLDEILASRPRAVIVHVGTNDLSNDVPVPRIVANHERMIERIGQIRPKPAVLLVSVLPTNRSLRDSALEARKRRSIPKVNAELARLASRHESVDFLDLTDAFSNADGELKAQLTHDGLHLKPEGYALYCRKLRAWMADIHPDLPKAAVPGPTTED